MSAELATYVPIEDLSNVPPPPPARPRVLLIATVLASAAAAMAFTALLAVYLSRRSEAVADTGAWFPGSLPLTPANLMLAGFGLSLVFMHWAVQAIGNDDRRHAWMAFGAVLLVGAFQFVGTGFLYSQAGFAVATPAGALFYAVSGGQLALTGAGLLFAALMAFRTLGGQYSARDKEGVVAATIFWWVVAATYAALWYSVYVTK